MGRLPADGVADGEMAVLCIRERGRKINTNGEGLAGRVRGVRFLGDVARVEISVEGFDLPLRARLDEGHGLQKGSEIRVSVSPSELLVFPASAS